MIMADLNPTLCNTTTQTGISGSRDKILIKTSLRFDKLLARWDKVIVIQNGSLNIEH